MTNIFLQDERPPIGWEAIQPTQRPTAPLVARIERLWIERDGIVNGAIDRGHWSDDDWQDIAAIEAEIEMWEEKLAAYHDEWMPPDERME